MLWNRLIVWSYCMSIANIGGGWLFMKTVVDTALLYLC